MIELAQRNPVAPPTIYAEAQYGRAVSASEGGDWRVASTPDGRFQVPLLIRPLSIDGARDAITPYGYGGIHIDTSLRPDERSALWSAFLQLLCDQNIISVFFRFAPFAASGSAAQVRALEGLEVEHLSDTVLVEISDPDSMWSTMRGRARTAVRAAEKAGLSATVGCVDEEGLDTFRCLYDQTMERVSAAGQHRHGLDYYHQLLEKPDRVRMVRVVDRERTAVASCLVLLDSDIAHYHLSGSSGTAPGATNLMLWRLLTWAGENERTSVHLGGGLRANDSLFDFKQSFGGSARPFEIGRLVVDRPQYEAMTVARSQELETSPSALSETGFFPAYRATSA
ncbi:GNAT family N-acetyltransferase [Aeromicrobium sp. CF4.19]|uniref:GNAT family N-acetyltransferase n=1 Tax=Aeromicrobium sp. CF4.19 TaxID=3373082 RepID=UPI003EE567BC